MAAPGLTVSSSTYEMIAGTSVASSTCGNDWRPSATST